MSFQDVRDELHTWVTGQAPELTTAFWWDKAGPKPGRPYAVLSFPSPPNNDGMDIRRYDGDTETMDTYGFRKFTLSVDVNGEGAQDVVSKLRNSVALVSVQEAFNACNLAFVQFLGTQDLSEWKDTEYEQRVTVDLEFRWSDKTAGEEVKRIDEVTGTGTIADAGGTETETDFEVNAAA